MITTDAAIALGATASEVRHLVKAGYWQRVHPQVFVAAGAAPNPLTGLACALAAGGATAAASHTSAAWLLRLIDHHPAKFHITVPPERRPRVTGTVVHRTALPPGRPVNGLACTPPLRTLIDVAAISAAGRVDAVVDRSLSTGLVRLGDLDRIIASTLKGHPGRRGVARLRASLRGRGYLGGPTPSVLESRMARLFVRYGIPAPRAELQWGPDGEYRLDYAYPSRRLAIEVNGYVWHSSPGQQERDHARANHLVTAGWRLLVHTWRDVADRPGLVAAEILSAYDAYDPQKMQEVQAENR